MATSNLALIRSNSNYTNFNTWSSAVHNFIITQAGWLQKPDTNQMMFSGMNITAVANVSGSTWRYTYNSLTGLALAVGMVLTITGFTGGATGDNGTFQITSLAGGAGTFDVTNPSGSATSGASAVVTQQSSVPTIGSGNSGQAYYYPNDGKTIYYLKVEYGSSTNPSMRVSTCTSTDGAGNATGIVSNLVLVPSSTTVTASTFNCFLSGDTEHLVIAMWCDDYTNQGYLAWGVQRNKNASGVAQSDYACIFGYSTASSTIGNMTWMHFTNGVPFSGLSTNFRFPHNLPPTGTANSGNVAGSCGVGYIANYMGKPDYPTDMFMVAWAGDYPTDLQQVVPANQPYGSSHTYVVVRGNTSFSPSSTLSRVVDGAQGLGCVLVRYD